MELNCLSYDVTIDSFFRYCFLFRLTLLLFCSMCFRKSVRQTWSVCNENWKELRLSCKAIERSCNKLNKRRRRRAQTYSTNSSRWKACRCVGDHCCFIEKCHKTDKKSHNFQDRLEKTSHELQSKVAECKTLVEKHEKEKEQLKTKVSLISRSCYCY